MAAYSIRAANPFTFHTLKNEVYIKINLKKIVMKKNILKPFLSIAVLCLFIITNTQAQSANKITISVKDIEYDDPNFTALRETLKKNPKVKLVNLLTPLV